MFKCICGEFSERHEKEIPIVTRVRVRKSDGGYEISEESKAAGSHKHELIPATHTKNYFMKVG